MWQSTRIKNSLFCKSHLVALLGLVICQSDLMLFISLLSAYLSRLKNYENYEQKCCRIGNLNKMWWWLACLECPLAGLMLRDSALLHAELSQPTPTKISQNIVDLHWTLPSAIAFLSRNISCPEIPDRQRIQISESLGFWLLPNSVLLVLQWAYNLFPPTFVPSNQCKPHSHSILGRKQQAKIFPRCSRRPQFKIAKSLHSQIYRVF